MSDPITDAIAPDIGAALQTLGAVARKQAEGRAKAIAELSSGTVTTSEEQITIMTDNILSEMISELRTQVRSAVVSFAERSKAFKGG